MNEGDGEVGGAKVARVVSLGLVVKVRMRVTDESEGGRA